MEKTMQTDDKVERIMQLLVNLKTGHYMRPSYNYKNTIQNKFVDFTWYNPIIPNILSFITISVLDNHLNMMTAIV